jgi:glucose-1-phosphate adenylyltransferase
MQDVLTLILGGGRGARLYPLTKRRSEPAVPLAGKYRLIDVPISNCLNSGLHQIYVLTQFLSVSLHRHLANTYKIEPFSRGFIEVLAAQQTNEAAEWYQGTADALRQNLRYLSDHAVHEVLVLSGDQIYRMDFAKMIRGHRDSKADVTMAVTPVRRDRTARLGILKVDESLRVRHFIEKPQTEEEREPVGNSSRWLEQQGVKGQGRDYLANMGIYLFNSAALVRLMNAYPTATDLVREILVPSLASSPIRAHLFDGYWEDLGTIKSYHEAHLALAGDHPPFDFNSPEGVIYTRMRNLPASRVRAAHVSHALIADGCDVARGAILEYSVLGVRSRIGANVQLRETVLIGGDDFETAAQQEENRRLNRPDVGIGDGSIIHRAIIDKDCRIGREVRIVNRGNVQNAEGDYHVIRDGIVVIPNGMTIPDGAVI